MEATGEEVRARRPNITEFIRNVIIGMSDGLTVPFAIAAGLAGAHATTTLIITAAMLAEIAAGSISMGLGGFLSAQTDADHYNAEKLRKTREVAQEPEIGVQEVVARLSSYGLSREESATVANSLRRRKDDWIDFIMHFELGLQEPDQHRALRTAAVIGGSYIVGGLIPLIPYFVVKSVHEALILSAVFTVVALLVFGFLRGQFIDGKPFKSMWQTVLVGGMAAGVAFVLARLVS